MIEEFRALCSLCGKGRCDMRLEIRKMFETAFGDDKVVYAKSRICPECIDRILSFINEEWGE